MNRLASIAKQDTLTQFAQGAAQEAIQPIADFLAPTVPVSRTNGRFKIYTEKHRFRIPDTLRAIGGRATELRFEATDGTYNCEPHALDYPVDNLEQFDARGLQDVLKEGATAVAEIAALAHEKTVIDMALAAAGDGTSKTWNASSDPVADIDDAVLTALKIASYGSLMGIGVLFGATAWNIFKNAAAVRNRFVSGGPKQQLAVASEEHARNMFIAKPEIRCSYMVYDKAPEGKEKDIDFMLTNTILIFARKPNPSTRDPSFMKTFRLTNKYLVPGSYVREDGRVEVAKFDWSEDVRTTNAAACIRLNVATS